MEQRIWVTKYALTSGIFVINAEVADEMAKLKRSDEHLPEYFYGKDWHATEAEALARAEEMKIKRIESLKKSLTKMEAMRFA